MSIKKLLNEGIVVDGNKASELNKNGDRTIIIASRTAGNFIVRFDINSINTFMKRVVNIPGWEDASPEKLYFANLLYIFDNDLAFMSLPDKRDLPTLQTALVLLKQHPWLGKTSQLISKRLNLENH